MNDTTLIILVVGLIIVLAVIIYNIVQERKYRKQIREQFGHADKDALLESQTEFVRDGKSQNSNQGAPIKPLRQKDVSQAQVDTHQRQNVDTEKQSSEPVATPHTDTDKKESTETVIQPEQKQAETAFKFEKIPVTQPSQTKINHKQKLLLNLDDLVKLDLPWFDTRFDYMAYISLAEPQELHAIPRLSSRHRFRIVGCTMDNRFQIAEPIPSVYYQGFVIGLQGISRNGLITTQEIEQFTEQVNQFAEKVNGGLLLTDIDSFLNVARPLDELCARVDQTITMHLVSRGSVSGVELRSTLESLGFELGVDGAFHLLNDKGETLFSIINLDNSPFTPSLLANQAYRGFSMLFDIPHVPAGEKQFNQFMDLAVKLSSTLGLDLVNDQLEELSTEWLKEVRTYVLARQDEMRAVHIEPASDLAKRLFA